VVKFLRLAAGNWWLATGGWLLATGFWQLSKSRLCYDIKTYH